MYLLNVEEKKIRYAILWFQRPLWKSVNQLIQITPYVSFKVKTFHQDITFRFHILLFPLSHQLAEKQGDSSKNETKLQTTGDTFLVSGCAQLQILCSQACLLPSLR